MREYFFLSDTFWMHCDSMSISVSRLGQDTMREEVSKITDMLSGRAWAGFQAYAWVVLPAIPKSASKPMPELTSKATFQLACREPPELVPKQLFGFQADVQVCFWANVWPGFQASVVIQVAYRGPQWATMRPKSFCEVGGGRSYISTYIHPYIHKQMYLCICLCVYLVYVFIVCISK